MTFQSNFESNWLALYIESENPRLNEGRQAPIAAGKI